MPPSPLHFLSVRVWGSNYDACVHTLAQSRDSEKNNSSLAWLAVDAANGQCVFCPMSFASRSMRQLLLDASRVLSVGGCGVCCSGRWREPVPCGSDADARNSGDAVETECDRPGRGMRRDCAVTLSRHLERRSATCRLVHISVAGVTIAKGSCHGRSLLTAASLCPPSPG